MAFSISDGRVLVLLITSLDHQGVWADSPSERVDADCGALSNGQLKSQ
jgi:hypothetical protein